MTPLSSLKILHLASHTGVFRGGAVQLCRMVRAQKRAGHEVCVIAPPSRATEEAMREQDVRSWDVLVKDGIPLEFLNFEGWRGALQLRRAVTRLAPDLVHTHRPEALVSLRRALIGTGRPSVVAQYGTTARPDRSARRAFASRRVGAIVGVAEAVKASLIETTAVDPNKVHVVYGSVDLDRFRPRSPDAGLLQELGFPEGSVIMGSLSPYRSKKGFPVLIPALAEAMEKTPNLRAVFMGKNMKRGVRKLAASRGIDERCRFVGHQDDVERWLSVMDFTVVASLHREGLSGVLRESLACGIPVISSDCSGNGEIVRHRETGLLVQAGDVDSLAEAISWAAAHRDEMRAMADEGHRWVEQHCTPEIQAGAIEAIYRQVLNGSGRGRR